LVLMRGWTIVGSLVAVGRRHGERRPPSSSLDGIFAAGDCRAKGGLKAMSPRRDQKSETTTREKWPQKQLFCWRAISCGFRKVVETVSFNIH
jgi:hypothetical protein